MNLVSSNEAALRIARIPVEECDSSYHTVLDISRERLMLDDSVRQLLIQTAIFRSKARSWRKFSVSAGVVGVNGTRVTRAFGYNIKLDETDTVNIHAEELALCKAVDMRIGKIAVIAVMGPVQNDTVSGRTMNTLLPCGQKCIPLLKDSPFVPDDTLIVTATPDFRNIELSTIGGIDQYRRTGNTTGIQSFNYPATPEVFGGLLAQPGEDGMNGFEDSVEVDETDWGNTVGLYLRSSLLG